MTIRTRFTTLVATIAAITLSSAHATAQPFIEIDVSGLMQDFSTGDEYRPFGLRAIFDAGAAPDGVFPSSIDFNAVWGEAVETLGLATLASTSPFTIDTELLEYIPADVIFTYIQSSNTYQIRTSVNGEELNFRVTDPVGAFSLAMTSLPDDLGDYQLFINNPFDEAGPVNFSMFSPSSGDGGYALWEGECFSCFNEGTIIVTIRVVDGPPQPECIADINNDGALNFLDISAYLQEYGNGCP